jgi:hypothetical protein
MTLAVGAPVCFGADFAAAAEILMRCTVLRWLGGNFPYMYTSQ